jgi:UDP-N-acetylmuramyl pentapeptide phosphotransferase/UDP-N-acetylglucosamine-1-phosphate transferase
LLVAAAAASAVLIRLLWSLLVRYAVAVPNSRSSHRVPTPQGGGIAVVIATVATTPIGAILLPRLATSDVEALIPILAGAVALAIIGACDDIRSIPIVPRLLIQATVVYAVIAMLPSGLRIAPLLPLWLERALLALAGVWFVNLTNFMDGLDWMTVAEVVPVTAGLALIGALGGLPAHGIVLAFVLCGAMLGFAPFNRPVARLFLGDVGSLPIGLMLGWLLVLTAGEGQIAAAVIVPLYYLADTGITLARRIVRREPFWQAHRSHFYQSATDRGFSVMQVVARVFAVNLGLVACAASTVLMPGPAVALIALACAAALVGWLLVSFARGQR